MIIDIFTLSKYNFYIADKKSDNIMIITEPYVENKTHVNIMLGSTNIRINNVCDWGGVKEYCFPYPVDFGSVDSIKNPTLTPALMNYYLNQWIAWYSRHKLYSDNNEIDLKSGKILSLQGRHISFQFSNFSSSNRFTKIELKYLFHELSPFKINIFNPFQHYILGRTDIMGHDDDRLRQGLIEESKLERGDYRFQGGGNKLFNINTLEEACKFLQLLLKGNTLTYDSDRQQYFSNSEAINFYHANQIVQNDINLTDENVYKLFPV